MTIEYSVNSCYMQNKVAYRNLTDNSLLVSAIDLFKEGHTKQWTKGKRTKRHTMVHKTLHSKLKVQQHEVL
jgi:hypothetical protein